MRFWHCILGFRYEFAFEVYCITNFLHVCAHKICMHKSQTHKDHKDRGHFVGVCWHSCMLLFATAVFGHCCLLHNNQACCICRNYNPKSKQHMVFTSDLSQRWKLSLHTEGDTQAYGPATGARQAAEASRIWCLIHSTWTGMSKLTWIAHVVCDRWWT